MQPAALVLYSSPLFRDLTAALLSAWGVRPVCLSMLEREFPRTIPAARSVFFEMREGDPRLSDQMAVMQAVIDGLRVGNEASPVYGFDVANDRILEFPRQAPRSLPSLEAAIRATAVEN